MTKIGYICPTYNAKQLDSYTRTALYSFAATTPGGVAVIVDDGTPGWDSYDQELRSFVKSFDLPVEIFHYSDNGGLTRSWNQGLRICERLGVDYAIASNNDIIFTDKWWMGLVHALDNGYHMAGPLSNAAGVTAKGKQDVWNYYDDYKLTDDVDYLNDVSKALIDENLGKVVSSPVNGFFQMAKMDSWKAGMYDNKSFYRPVNLYTSKGYKNKTPLMTLNEDELQGRWARKNMRSCVCLSSFVFHYRAVTRGNKYKRGKWYRK
jgi:glycosyltransferase involved in cell wall biosynthesis